jgi:hypothetical protein
MAEAVGEAAAGTVAANSLRSRTQALGTKDGRRQALFFQFGGGSSTALPRGGDWRCIPLDGLEDVVLRDGPWHRAGGWQECETCVDEIDVEVPHDL